jgi:hypothetical protein
MKKKIIVAGYPFVQSARICPGIGFLSLTAGVGLAQKVVVDTALSYVVNTFSPFRALGA